jgi:hypothetical protein
MSKHEREPRGSNRCSNADNKDQDKEELLPQKKDDRDIALSRKDARGGSPADASVGGEEDAGVGLEFVVRKDER